MSFQYNLYGISNLIKDMRRNNYEIDEFNFTFNAVEFNAIIDISVTPFQLLLGTVNHNWASVLEIEKGYSISMSSHDFISLCDILGLKAGKNTFTSFMFFSYINKNIPSKCSLKIVRPSHLMPFRKRFISTADEQDKTVFIGWNDHKKDGRTARNFNKTKLFFGNNVMEFCIKNNISSLWTTPDKADERDPSYPPGFKKE